MGIVVDADYFGIDCLSDLKDLGGRADLVVGYLRDVDKPVNSRDDLGKGSERHQADDLYLGNVADPVPVREDLPRVGLLGLVPEGDSLRLRIEVLDIDMDRLADRNHV